MEVKKFGLLGYPLGHSISDYIHRRIFELCGLTDCEYSLYEVNPEELSLKGGKIKELSGFNVTIPYKSRIIPFLTRLDESAARYEAVNCVRYLESTGEYIGYNTDVHGFLKSVEVLGADLGGKVLLLGCGGTARMMAFEAIGAGADLTVAIRRDSQEEKAAAKLSREIGEVLGRFFAKTSQLGLNARAKLRITYADRLNIADRYDLLLNATPCGMYPDTDALPVSPDILGKVKHLFDAVYNPVTTKLVSEAEKRGVIASGGLTMLVHQAIMAEKIWNDVRLGDKAVENLIEGAREELERRAV
jgi:shikimate dehydrogenase